MVQTWVISGFHPSIYLNHVLLTSWDIVDIAKIRYQWSFKFLLIRSQIYFEYRIFMLTVRNFSPLRSLCVLISICLWVFVWFWNLIDYMDNQILLLISYGGQIALTKLSDIRKFDDLINFVGEKWPSIEVEDVTLMHWVPGYSK